MESKVYSLTSPYNVEEVIKEKNIPDDWVVIEPKLGAVCHADLRYFTGNRRPEALKVKLPMALIHEGLGEVIETKSNRFKVGDRVSIVPNIPGRLFDDYVEGDSDKYSSRGKFMGSGYDGIAQSRIVHPEDCLVKIPDSISDEIALLAEMSSVSISAFKDVAEKLAKPDTRLAIIGDGPVGYFAAAYIYYKYNFTKDRFSVFGADQVKMNNFTFAETFNSNEVNLKDFDKKYDVIIEATGGRFSETGVNQAIDMLDYYGTLVLMGVTEERVPINTRDVLEKGLTLIGSSRSTTEDFKDFMELAEKSEDYRDALQRIIPDEFFRVTDADSFYDAMKYAAETPHWQKVVMEYIWE